MVLNKRFKLIAASFCLSLCYSTISFAQLYTKLQWMPAENHWGIFVKADSSVQPTRDILLGTGQLTVVVPTGFQIKEMTSYMGAWIENARANTPIERPEKDYISFGVQLSEPVSQLGTSEEALILTFSAAEGDCPASLNLIEKDDPFMTTSPNSLNTNPGNDLQLIDIGNGVRIYEYNGNYAEDSWNCNENITTSLREFEKKPTIKVYPNPFKETINIELLDKNRRPNLQITIQDNLGKIVHRQLMQDNKVQIALNLAPALYIYQVIDLASKELVSTGKLLHN